MDPSSGDSKDPVEQPVEADSLSQSAPDPVTIAVAEAPFNDPDADVVICSVDNVHFRVYRVLLSLASPFFKDMFRLPQPSSDQGATDEAGRPIIPIAEVSKTAEMMLRFCYPPVNSISLDTLEDIQAMLNVMTKYDMHSGIELVRKQLTAPGFVKKSPLRVFAISYRYQLKEEAILAMKNSIYHPIMCPDYSELKHIPASGYHQYLMYRMRCIIRVKALLDPDSRSSAWSSFGWHGYGRCGCSIVSVGSYDWKIWFYDCVRSIIGALTSRPCPEALVESVWLSDLEKACGFCARRARKDFLDFVTVSLAAKIRKTISEVPLDLDL